MNHIIFGWGTKRGNYIFNREWINEEEYLIEDLPDLLIHRINRCTPDTITIVGPLSVKGLVNFLTRELPCTTLWKNKISANENTHSEIFIQQLKPDIGNPDYTPGRLMLPSLEFIKLSEGSKNGTHNI